MKSMGAGSLAPAAMMVVYSIAPWAFSVLYTPATVLCFWPTAT